MRYGRRSVSATGSAQITAPRDLVWQALTVLGPYCPFCDVSYPTPEDDLGERLTRLGAGFICVPGHVVDVPLDEVATPRGEVIDWEPPRRVGTRLDLTAETWTTLVNLEDSAGGRTRVSALLTYQAKGGYRLAGRLERQAVRKLVESSLRSTLAKIPLHVQLLFSTRE